VERAAGALEGQLRARLARVAAKTSGRPRPRVLIAVDHGSTAGRIESVYAAGSDPFFCSILRSAGGRNVFEGTAGSFPVVSREAIVKTNPEVIVDLVSANVLPPGGAQACRENWCRLEQIDAVTAGRVHVLTEDYAKVPGPRFILLVERLARLLHPEVDWQQP
jgi:iron complex transport system substrate-binding protein